jgi:hypothetical protein
MTTRNTPALAGLLVATAIAGCARTPAEPTDREIHGALQSLLEQRSEAGRVFTPAALPAAGRRLQFAIRLRAVEKKSCVGKERVYTCLVSARLSFPPVKDEPERHELSLVLFDGPGGWRIIE